MEMVSRVSGNGIDDISSIIRRSIHNFPNHQHRRAPLAPRPLFASIIEPGENVFRSSQQRERERKRRFGGPSATARL